MVPSAAAIEALNQALRLPATGREQDWDVELADPDRAAEFVGYLEGNDLPPEQRHALMSLILGSLDELAQDKDIPDRLWARVQRLLDADARLYAGLVGYWAAADDVDGFAISPKIRALAWDSLPARGR